MKCMCFIHIREDPQRNIKNKCLGYGKKCPCSVKQNKKGGGKNERSA